jgi:hypothetical protein
MFGMIRCNKERYDLNFSLSEVNYFYFSSINIVISKAQNWGFICQRQEQAPGKFFPNRQLQDGNYNKFKIDGFYQSEMFHNLAFILKTHTTYPESFHIIN